MLFLFTGYRYYSVGQSHRLNRILALKDLGLSLAQIARLLDDDLPPALTGRNEYDDPDAVGYADYLADGPDACVTEVQFQVEKM